MIPADAASHPACLPITSNIKTFVDVSDIDLTSNDASRVDVAIYLATEPKPGQQCVMGKSLSIVLGKPIQVIGYFFNLKYLLILLVVSCESPPPL